MIDINLLLVWGATYKKFGIGKTIFAEGQSCFYYHQLVSGKARWVNVDNDGKEFIHTLVEPGESFGEIPIFDDGTYAATAITDEESLVIRLSKSKFLKLIKENGEISLAFTKLLAKRLRFKFLIIKSFSSHSPEHRIATLLNYLKSENKNFYTDGTQLKLTRQQIADMTGLRVETVIRTMRVMHDKGELVIAKGKVYCKDMIEILSL
ncbi:putative transcriptional regulator, Crp/Fnr family [Arcticibacter svalbardensis MN12-7]|uniref:Putative transcriptional regulator, Crp/Fnr family n=1 Tax=Arcticibacter svalbardensis MN12-7 TaxID=1150600 RepID=R9GNU7_9SPHI|nr:Crp/Fnr family transcriptional regulator [Arcticibacter svalbardensis]EOR93386.1 putative transcriptional regulator, Crp/Fnr family [Arcticibacter svalbardensis MN12-7]